MEFDVLAGTQAYMSEIRLRCNQWTARWTRPNFNMTWATPRSCELLILAVTECPVCVC